MEILLKNEIHRPIHLRLLNGRTVNLSPSLPPVSMSDDEVNNNPRIKKLIDRGDLSKVEAAQKVRPEKKGGESEASSPAGSSIAPNPQGR